MPDSAVYPPNGGAGILLGQSGAAVSHTGDTTETVLATIAVPANLLGKNGQIVVRVAFSRNGSGTATSTQRVRFGASGAGVAGVSLSSGTLSTALLTGSGMVVIANTNATNSQVTSLSSVNLYTPYTTSSAAATAGIDTTAATEVAITGTLVNIADTITLVSYQVLAYPRA